MRQGRAHVYMATSVRQLQGVSAFIMLIFPDYVSKEISIWFNPYSVASPLSLCVIDNFAKMQIWVEGKKKICFSSFPYFPDRQLYSESFSAHFRAMHDLFSQPG